MSIFFLISHFGFGSDSFFAFTSEWVNHCRGNFILCQRGHIYYSNFDKHQDLFFDAWLLMVMEYLKFCYVIDDCLVGSRFTVNY